MMTHIRKLKMNRIMIAVFVSASMLFSQSLMAQTCQQDAKAKKQSADVKYKKMYQSAADGDLATLKILIEEKGVDVNSSLKNKQTALLLSSYNGHIESVKYLIGKGADINMKNKWENAAIHDASMKGHAKIASLLIDKGADVNMKGKWGYSPLHFACQNKRPWMTKVLVDKGADVSALDGNGRPPIIQASWSGEPKIVSLLVDNGADVNAATKDKNYVMHNIARGGHNEALAILLEKGANANVTDNNGRLPLHYSVINGHAETTKRLLKKTSKINIKEETLGNTPLHIAAVNGDKLISEILLNAGAKANIENNNSKKPIDYAVKYGYSDLVGLYVEKNLASNDDLKSAQENRNVNKMKVSNGEAQVVYSGHSGWIVNTENKVLVFDYWSEGSRNQPGLVNGTFNPEEMKGKEVFVFASHSHSDHYDPIIHSWKEDVEKITYIYGFDAKKSWNKKKTEYAGPEFIMIPDNEMKELKGGVKVTTLKSNDSGQGFLVEVDGISIFHPGDHAWFAKEDEDIFKKEIDFVANKNNQVDIAFLPVSGCPSRWQKEYIISGFFYSIDKLNPKQVFPMHAFQREYTLKEFAELAEQKKSQTNIVCAENKGDNFMYNSTSVASK